MPEMMKKKPPSRKRKQMFSLIHVLLAIWGSVWGFGMLQLYLTTTNVPPSTRAEKEESLRQQQAKNAFYGYQPTPSIHMNSTNNNTCKIQNCLEGNGTFEAHPNCPICDDNPQDFGVAPNPGSSDWIPDAKMLHSMLLDGRDKNGNPWPPALSRDYCLPMSDTDGSDQQDGAKVLFDRVPIRSSKTTRDTDSNGPTIFCGVYTTAESHSRNIRAIRETWAPRCDGFVAFSTATDPRIPALKVEHEGPEEYDNMWQKARSIWRYIGEHYRQDFDYFILGGIDLLLIPDNLREYLRSLNQSSEMDLFAGRPSKEFGPNEFHGVCYNSGGAGYVLSKATLRKFFDTGLDHPECGPQKHTAAEDVMITECLRKVFNVSMTDTRDDEGRERFHATFPGPALTWQHPNLGRHFFYPEYNKEWGRKFGMACCAPNSVSFHYVKKPTTMRHLWALLHDCD